MDKVDQFGQIYITQHSRPYRGKALSTWMQSNAQGDYVAGYWNANIMLWIIRPRSW